MVRSRIIFISSLYIHIPFKAPDYENRQWKCAMQIVYSYTWVPTRPPMFIPLYPILSPKCEWFQTLVLRRTSLFELRKITNPFENASEVFPDLIWKSLWWDNGINQQKTNSTWSSNPIVCFPAIIIVIFIMLFASEIFLLNIYFAMMKWQLMLSANEVWTNRLYHILLTNND